MSYLEDSIDWQAVDKIDAWLDKNVGIRYLSEPLGQDWARISKVQEELGEAIAEFILLTGQNPRKEQTSDLDKTLTELADVVITGILAIQHFTKNTTLTKRIIKDKLASIERRANHEIYRRS